MTDQKPIIAAADGSALGNPGPAGWAWYIDEDHWASGGWKKGTNNMGELKAVLDLFESTAHVADRPLHIFCDSKYTIDSITKWMPGWKKKGWKKSDGKPVLNQDLMKALDRAISGRTYTFEWVKGHAGHELNEIVDELARAAATAYKKGEAPEAGPGFGEDRDSVSSASSEEPEDALAFSFDSDSTASTGDAVEDSDRAEEEEHSARIAEIGPERLAAHQEDLLLRKEVYTDEQKLDSLLTEDFCWITPAGRTADRATVLEHRERAFVSVGEPEPVSAQLLGESAALVVSRVTTPRGQVLRSSVWVRENYRNEIGAWLLHFRQETAC